MYGRGLGNGDIEVLARQRILRFRLIGIVENGERARACYRTGVSRLPNHPWNCLPTLRVLQ